MVPQSSGTCDVSQKAVGGRRGVELQLRLLQLSHWKWEWVPAKTRYPLSTPPLQKSANCVKGGGCKQADLTKTFVCTIQIISTRVFSVHKQHLRMWILAMWNIFNTKQHLKMKWNKTTKKVQMVIITCLIPIWLGDIQCIKSSRHADLCHILSAIHGNHSVWTWSPREKSEVKISTHQMLLTLFVIWQKSHI